MTTGERALGDILWLGEPACHDRTVVGGKAANLSRLTATHRVPPGFCLAAPVFNRARADGSEPTALPPAVRDELAVAHGEKMGWPVDVECAYEDGRLYLLQCRPVTALDGLRTSRQIR